ncbi:hypothetical protein OsJ_24807 [Oryza sativa Japonica Group]|uniref:Phytocyanin domain-containing protein n=1 Tax=Oryza sativa subsp. japonica TaxID=39947 RepID=A3BLC2_ORYSJ|nr:hypothetical protein OsJ_24807 [Oryza sativa Japonica Group]
MAVAVAAAAALVVMWAGTATAAAAVYEVGDKTGWTIMGSPNYTAWAASKKFHLGDTVETGRGPELHFAAISAIQLQSLVRRRRRWSVGHVGSSTCLDVALR